MLTNDQQAPAFNTIDQNGDAVSLNDFAGKQNIVLYFYPKDDTPGCTIEANQFTALKEKFDALDTVILGVSKDSEQSHCDFIKKFDLNLTLLADTSGELCESYDVWQDKGKDGTVKMGIVRSTFIIDKNSIIKSAEYGVSADGHAQAVYDFISTKL